MLLIEKIRGLQRRLTVTVPAKDIEKAYQTRLKEFIQTAKLPKFRPGKVPPKIVERRFGKAILQEVSGKLIEATLANIVKENSLKIAGMLKVEFGQVSRGKSIDCVVNYEVYPAITLNSLEGEKVERLNVIVSKKDIDNILNSLRTQYSKWKVVNRAAKFGDQVIIDFFGSLHGKSFKGGNAKELTLELGSNRMISDFEQGIEGMKPGDTKTVNVTFPMEYPNKKLSGKSVNFTIKMHKVLELELPLLDNKFVEKLGIKEGGIEALQANVKEKIEKEMHYYEENKLKMAVLDKLIERNPIEVPKILVDVEIEYLKNLAHQKIANQTGKSKQAKKLELPRRLYLEKAKRRVILGLLLAEVIKKHNIRVDSEQLMSRIKEIASAYLKPDDVVSWYYNNKNKLSEVESVVLEDKAIAVLLNQVEVEKRDILYEEIVHKHN